jgi:ribonuclease-3
MNDLREKYKTLEKNLGYTFKNLEILEEALSHPSIKYEKRTAKTLKNYEKLEFLGDSVIGFIVAEFLYKNYPDYKEGKLARVKGTIVSSEFLAKMGRVVDLGKYMILSEGEEKSGGRDKSSNVEDVFEALMAAIYLDCNDIKIVYKIFVQILIEILPSNLNSFIYDPKTMLQEWAQANYKSIPIYLLVDSYGQSHDKIFACEVSVNELKGIGFGKSIKLAEKAAAVHLLELIQNKQ